MTKEEEQGCYIRVNYVVDVYNFVQKKALH